MTSHAMGKCCVVGVKHEGTALGEDKTVGGVRTYLSYPKDKSTQNAIIIYTDVIGLDAINVQLIADQFAQNGYFVAIPDLFNGNPVPMNPPEGFNIWDWMKTDMPHPPTVDPIIAAVIKELRDSYGVKKLGGVGYCFGGKYVARTLKEGGLSAGGIDVGYTAHPSFVDREELEGVVGPLSISAAVTDEIFPADKRHESEEILLKKTIPYQIYLYSDVVHGFAVRADIAQPRQKFAKEQAFYQAVAWFDEYLKNASSKL